MAEKKYDWIIAGGGVSGIAIAELLCRDRMSVLLLEKNKQLVSETSKVFHEWMHSGALYSLVPDNLLTLRYLLGATDDLFEYYADDDFDETDCREETPHAFTFPPIFSVNVVSSFALLFLIILCALNTTL